MYMGATARVFGQVGPRWQYVLDMCAELGVADPARGLYWPDLCYAYAEALLRVGLRYLPLAGANLHAGGRGRNPCAHWNDLPGAFNTPLATRYVNIVIASVNDARQEPYAEGSTPQFAGKCTAGMRNIAITSLAPDLPTDLINNAMAQFECRQRQAATLLLRRMRARTMEPDARGIAALGGYDLVVCPDPESAAELVALGVDARCYRAEQLAADAASLPMFLECV